MSLGETEALEKKVYFLDDQPKKDLQEEDAFGHVYYARTLYSILENTETSISYAIGLFGKWGIGKTTIINELDRLIKENATEKSAVGPFHNYKLLKLDAWEYSDENFRREFLLDLGERFNCRKKVKSKITTKEIREEKESPRASWPDMGKQLVRFAALYFLAFIPVVLIGIFLRQTIVPLLITGSAAGLLSAFHKAVLEALKPKTIVRETAPAVHPDEFKDIFNFVLGEKPSLSKENDRLIIVLDNLDRVRAEIVIQILNAVKSFLNKEKCIYILPCDDKGLKQHIMRMRMGLGSSERMTESKANEYLRKFFQTTLTIRDLLKEDLESFTDQILNKLKILDLPIPRGPEENEQRQKEDEKIKTRNRHEVALILRIAIAKNPRRIIQLVNKLSANYLLAQEKGKENSQLRSNILSNLGFLAKVTVIEEEWPEFYTFMTRYPDSFRQLHNYFLTEDKDNLPQLLKNELDKNHEDSGMCHEWDDGLKDFLRQAQLVHTEHVADFLLFKQKPTELLIANYYAFRDAAINRDVELVKSTIEDQATDVDAAFAELLDALDDQVRGSNIPNSLSLAYCLAEAFKLIPDNNTQLQQQVATRVAATLSKKPFETYIVALGLPKVLKLLYHAQDSQSIDQVVCYIIQLINFKGELKTSQFSLEQMIENHTLLSSNNKEALRGKLAEPSQEDQLLEYFRGLAKKIQEKKETLSGELIPQELYVKNITLLGSPGKPADQELEFLREFFVFFEPKTAIQYIDVILKHLQQPERALTPPKVLAFKCINLFPSELVPESKKKPLIERLSAYHNQLGNVNQKDQVTKAFLHLLPVLEPEEQQLYQPRFLETINSSSPELLLETIQVVQEQKETLQDLQAIVEGIRNRVQSHFVNDKLRAAFYTLANFTENRNHINVLVVAAWGQPDHDLKALEESKSVLKVDEFRSLLADLLRKTASLPPAQFERTLEALGKYPDKCTKEFLHTLTEELLNSWFQNSSVQARRGAKKLWQGIRKKAKDEVERFHERLLEYSRQVINDNTITEEPHKVYMETLLEDHEYLSSEHGKAFVSICLRMIEGGKPPVVKNYGHQVLRELVNDTYAQKRAPKEVISDLEQCLEQRRSDQDIRNNFDTLLQYKVHLSRSINDRLSKIFQNSEENPVIQEFKDTFLQ
ncbi:hypothetical protein KAU37_01930 [Candidatus Bipolaricaulota bacterium]|nr:hypothetical protein [Candidatus Bipolaricaulota bacterium]